jgi:hypothetical protein
MDEYEACKGIEDEYTLHATGDHRRKERVVGQVHTNTIESVWNLLDHSIIGAYHKVFNENMPPYLGEVAFPFNNRENLYLFRNTLRCLIEADTVRYEALVA